MDDRIKNILSHIEDLQQARVFRIIPKQNSTGPGVAIRKKFVLTTDKEMQEALISGGQYGL